MAPSHSSHSLSRSRPWTRTRIHSQSQSLSLSLSHQSRSITITHAICLTFLFSCALSAILNVTAQSAPYSSADPSGPIQRNLWAQSPVFASFQGNTDYTKWDALIANGYASCETGPGTGVYYPCPKPTGGVIPWSLSCAGVLNPQGQAYASGQCPFQYSRYDGSNNAQTNYGEIFLHIPLSNIRAGTVLNFVGAVSQIYEAKSSETHYIFVDYFRGPFNHANFANGYFEPQVTNGATTYLFRDVILQEPAASYPNYTMINHNRPLPTNVTFAILHLAVSSGANPPPTHPQSIFDIKAYARELVTGPKVNIFYNGPTPARQTARVYLSTTQCLISGNFTNPQSQLSIVASSGVPILSQSLSLVTPGANQLYALDLTFPAGVTGDVTITMPSGSVYNEFNLPNNASNTLKLPVLTLVPSLTIYSPNYPIFPNAQQQRNIQFLFNFTTDVYGFDITRVGLCRTNYQNDTCATTDYKYVTTGTTTWEFPGFGNVTGTFLIDPNPAYIRRNYTLNLSNVPDGTYRVLVKRTDALSQASENLDADAFSRSPIRVDNVRPTVTITPNAPLNATQTGLTTYVNKDQLVVFRLVFSELIKHPLTSSQLQVIGGTIPTNGITPIVTEPQSTAPSNTWCTSITTANNNPATSSCRSEYFVQVNHAGTDPVRSIITLSYFPSDTVTALSIVDLANNPLNSTGTSFPEGFRNGSITFSNQNPTATLAVLESDLLTNEFAVSGQFKTHLPTVRYNITFDYPVENFDFAAQYAANNFTVAVTRFGAPATIPNTITWGPTTKLDNYTFQSNLTYGMNVPTTLLRLQLKPLSVADVAGNFNLQSNEHLLVIDTKPPNCTSVTYAAGQDRFAPLHTNFTNIRTLQYIFTFDERVNQATASAWATTFNNIYSRAHGGTFTFTTQDDPSTSLFSRVTATYTAASGVTDNGLNVAVRLRNVTDVFQNTAFEPFLLCTPLSFEFDFDPPNMTFTTDLNPFARINSTHLHVAPRYGAPLTKNSSVVITFQFDEAVNLTQAALLYRLEKSTTTLVNANTNITGFQGYNCNAAPFGQFCRNFNVTVVGEDTSYSILQIDPAAAPFVTDLAGNGVRNAGLNYTYLTDQTPPSVVLSTIYPFLDPSFRSNRQLVQIDLTFSKHIARFPGLMTGNCSNTTHSVTLTSVPLNYNGDPTSRTVFNALFNVSQADLMTCEFRIGPDAVFDTVGNTLTRTYSIFVSTRFQSPNAIITSPRGWLTNDLNPIPFCIVTDTEVVLFTPNFGGSSDALNITTGAFNRTQTATVPRVYDAILNQDLPTQNRTYNATSRTYCADIIPTSSAVTDIRVVIANGTIRDVYNNTNMLEFSLQIRRFDLNPYTYENLVKDGIIENRKLANNSVSGRNIQDGTIEQRHMANGSVGTNQLIDGSVLRQDIAHGAVGSNEIAAGSINNTHLANSSVDTVKLADGAVTNTKLANNSITSEKIVDGSILTQDLANNSITFDKLVADAVRTINILNGSITTEKIAREAIVDYLLSNNSVETRDIKERAVTTTKIAIEAVTGTELANNSVVRRHLTNGSVDSTAILDGTIQQIDLANNSVGRPQLQNDSVNEFKLANLSIETRHIKSGAVTVEELAIDAVTSVEIVNGSILHVDMANSSVGTYNIIPNSVTFLNMANNSIDEFNLVNSSVTERSIRDSAVTTSKIANEAVTNPKVAPNTINTTQIQDSGVTEINVANNSISSRTIIPQAVGTREIADSSIVNVKLANSSVSYRTIATGSIDSSKIIPGSILTESLSPQAIATINFQNRSILNEFIAPNAINSSQIQPGAVDTINIAVEAVGTAQLGYRSVTGEKIAFDTITLSHFTDDVNQYLAAIQAELSTSRPLDGSYIHNASLHGYKLANGAVGTPQIADSAVTTAKIAENAVTWFQIAPKTINSDNLGDFSVLGAAIAHGQIAPHHLVPDFFTNATLTNLANSLTNEVKGLDTDNFAPGSINAAQVVTPGSVTNDLIGDKEISLRKLSDSGFNMFVNMYNRLAQLEAQMTALLNNIDSRCIFNTTFSVATPAPVTPNVLSTHTPMHTSSVEHYMSIHPDLVAEMERRATEKNAPRTFHTAQVNAVNKYPATIVDGAKYCGDGAGKPANNGTQAPDNSGVILNSAANMNPSTLVMAVLALLLAFVQL